MAHGHVHAPHELSESGHSGATAVPRRERILELGAVLLLSLTTVATAWSGYQAARWSGEQSQHYARASTIRIQAQRDSTQAGQLRIDDVLQFNGWLDAHNAGNRKLANVYRRRFRPEFVPAFDAWLAQEPFKNPSAIPGPQFMPQYRSASAKQAETLDGQADSEYKAGTDAKSNDDKYILSTVFFAAVLFFAGISLRLDWAPLRIGVLCLGAAMLGGGITFVLTLPIA
jgi:hypothetical protein